MCLVMGEEVKYCAIGVNMEEEEQRVKRELAHIRAQFSGKY